MSIEKDLSRIADALEQIALVMANPLVETSAGPESAPEPAAPAPAPTAAAPVAEPTSTVAPVPTPASMTVKELNDALVVEMNRLGGREPIDKLLQQHGVTSITDLSEDQYDPLVEAARSLTA